ncbi:helix-turn-helix domain-containing protein [Allosphingosinicella sp.]|uniref:helix-turn-helix domain-containing protein n=1 Tax=Allosphingosinicella sp. TaxID=2823234 RepID=UPI0037832314
MNEGNETAAADPSAATFLVETPEQLKALADPLRQSLLEQFCKPATIKQAAAKLEVPVTRLYHHVDQLLAAGLIRVAREEKRRAVSERFFEAVARRFAVSPSAFGGEGSPADERGRIARAYLEEVLAGGDAGEGAFRLMRTKARLTDEGRARLENEIARLLKELTDPDAPLIDLMMVGVRQD